MATIHIGDQGELAAITNGNDYILDNDILLDGTWATLPPLTDVTLDGQGHTLSNLTAPLFSRIRVSTVQNLNLIANINESGSNVGALAENLYDNTTIENNSVSGQVRGDWSVGGLIGQADGTNIVVQGNTNCALVNGESVIGGIIGVMAYYSDIAVNGNKNYGAVTGDNVVGGIVGYAYTNDGGTGSKIQQNENHAPITSNLITGGIIGLAQSEIVSGNQNDNSVTSNKAIAGGILGNGIEKLTAEKNENSGDVSANSSDDGLSGAGGIVGVMTEITEDSVIRGNKNLCGTVTASDGGAGGIVGLTVLENSTAPITIDDNTSYATKVTASEGAQRVLGENFLNYNPQLIVLSNNTASPNTLLTGDNVSQGGLVYDDETIKSTDPNLGADKPQGLSQVCPSGEVFADCRGCVKAPPTDKFAVKFNSCNGVCISCQTVTSGDKATEPPTPKRCGYTFVGWFTKCDPDQYDFDTAVTADLCLYAKWERKCGCN
ncbi:MAG: InlB B-repeat-containing protein [Oscillospiraceae bacterium]|jgi:uncharacterized repeat protein (TIGR02543 family)|nr:InlB B-repeat-containing protein [Oscillospiraceae bacterium]